VPLLAAEEGTSVQINARSPWCAGPRPPHLLLPRRGAPMLLGQCVDDTQYTPTTSMRPQWYERHN
jgi:hypothetical protein